MAPAPRHRRRHTAVRRSHRPWPSCYGRTTSAGSMDSRTAITRLPPTVYQAQGFKRYSCWRGSMLSYCHFCCYVNYDCYIAL
jgi:hypothetical protein